MRPSLAMINTAEVLIIRILYNTGESTNIMRYLLIGSPDPVLNSAASLTTAIVTNAGSKKSLVLD